MRRLGITAALVLALAGLLALGGLAGAQYKGSTTVKLLSDSFSPDKKSVSKGTKVKFKWVDGKHNIIKSKGPGGPIDSGIYSTPGVNFKKKFKKAGKYKLVCTLHENMILKLKVKN
jgi:plastocyanin